MTSSAAVTVGAAARIVGISRRMVQKDIDAGAPTIERGRRGRSSSLLDLAQYIDWRENRPKAATLPVDYALFADLAAKVIARIMVEAYRKQPTRARAADYAALWFNIASEISVASGAGELAKIPAEIRSLERAAFGSIGSISALSALRQIRS